MSKRRQADESEALLDERKTSDGDDETHRSQASRFEWAESSWTRLFHVLCWLWLNPTFSLASKRNLTQNDLDAVPHVDSSLLLLDRLHSYDWSTTTTWSIVLKEFWKDNIAAIVLFFLLSVTCIIQPLLLRQLILNMTERHGSNTLSCFYVVLLFISLVLFSVIERQAVFRSIRAGVRIRTALVITIYKHLLSLKSTACKQINTGQIINLIANDTAKFEDMYRYLSMFWAVPLETITIFGLAAWLVHPISVICGFALFCLFIIIQMYFGRKFGQHREITTLCSDKRMQAFNEFIHGCHVVKMYNWEKPMEDRITKLRENELASIRRTSLFRALTVNQYYISTSVLTLTTLGSAWLLGYPLNAANIFPVLLFFAFIRRNAMYTLPLISEKVGEARFASKRIDSFIHMTIEQQDQFSSSTPSINQQEKGTIVMSNASFSWHNNIPCLQSLSLTIQQGTFVAVVGSVGSGKSSLLAAILDEMNLIDGQLNTSDSSFSYAAQLPWIFTETFRNNILLNQSFNEQRYRDIIHACCLDVDLTMFGSSGDLTIIGENGINLSGGQKARVGLARALYADADIYLLDDPLSAVDPTVAKQIYERCIGPRGLLKNKTRLLVTHQTQFLHDSDQTIFLSHGRIDDQGYLDKTIMKSDDSNKKTTSVLNEMLDESVWVPDTQPIITDETSSSDDAKWSIWYRLFTAPPLGTLGFCLLIAVLLLTEVFNSGANYWLSICLKESGTGTDQQFSPKLFYIYSGLIIATIFADLVRTNYYFTVILNGSNSLHNNMLRGLLHTSIQFFESNPTGRILNRPSKDQQVIDEALPIGLWYGIIVFLISCGSMFIICLINPTLSLLLIVLVPALWFLVRFYRRSALQFKRIESITRSTVYALFVITLDGLLTIRAFKAENSFIQLISDRINTNTSAHITVEAATQWFALRLAVLCSLILLIISVPLLLFPNQTDSSTTAISLISAIYISTSFQSSIRQFLEMDTLMVSAERIDEYSHLPREEDRGGYKRLVKTSPTWPAQGTIEFRNYSLRHRSNLEYVIKNINLRIEAGQKIGIIGRTGAGKSSLFKGICRFLHRSNINGEILIDDIDISRTTLDHLRSHLTVIPQQSILFSGTLRYNLDPFNHYSDQECWKALEDVQLKQFVSNQAAGLLMPIAESGNNLSVGQCQLISIARAILKKSKILLVDEATANVDKNTDNLIQSVINEQFQDRTVMTIAHRLNTVAKCDYILVLHNGMMVNYDTSTNILRSYS